MQAIELIARHVLQAGTFQDPASDDERLAVYRAGIRLHLYLLALHLAQEAGRIPGSAAEQDAPAHDRALRAFAVAGPEPNAGARSPARSDPADPARHVHRHSPLLQSRADLLVQDALLSEASLLQAMVAAAGEAANSPHSPGTKLSRAYETLLAHAPGHTPRFTLLPDPAPAKKQGSFYTRPALARAVVEGALRPLRARHTHGVPSIRVLDPAMGAGVFLLEAVSALARAGAGAPAEVAENCVYGYDLDPLAVEIAVLSLWIETGARRHILAYHLRPLDAVRSDSPPAEDRFDVVVGNPPWGVSYSPAERTALRERWRLSASGSFDSFKLFLELATEQSDGTIGMIVPRAVLGQSAHVGVRELLLRRFAPYEVRILGAGEFPRAVAPACSLIFGPKPGPHVIPCRVPSPRSGGRPEDVEIPARCWTRYRFPLADSTALDLLGRLCRRHPRLGQIPDLYKVRDAGINYNRAAVARRILYEGDIADDPRDLPRYRGRNFDRYGAVRQGGWLRHNASLQLQPGEQLYLGLQTYELPEKVVFRQTADRIIATLDETRMAMGRSVIAVVAAGDALLLPLLACLNSALFTRLYRAVAGEEGRILPQVKVRMISLLPLPSACLDDRRNERWIALGELARARLACSGSEDRLEAEIEDSVCALFGLSPGETHE